MSCFGNFQKALRRLFPISILMKFHFAVAPRRTSPKARERRHVMNLRYPWNEESLDHRNALLYAMGISEEDAKRPVIGLINT